MQGRPQLSAVLITRDAASQLQNCLESLHFVDEIVVIDSGSSDQTKAIAERFSARFEEHPWSGFGPQKNIAVSRASHDWVLCVDADEVVSGELADAIKAALLDPLAHVFEIARRNFFMGRYLRHGEGYPDWSIRLFDRRQARWSDDQVHERVMTEQPVARFKTHQDLLHRSAESLSRYIDKQNRYTTIQAEQMRAMGVTTSTAQLILSPMVRFIRFYIFRLGFLDGVPGLVHIAIGSFCSFMKYAKLSAMTRESKS
jgi:glycosyltransferase involved in cell wall biosynthesis